MHKKSFINLIKSFFAVSASKFSWLEIVVREILFVHCQKKLQKITFADILFWSFSTYAKVKRLI